MKIKRICGYCGSEFEVILSRIKQGEGKFCSRGCYREAHKKIQRICQQCGKEFGVRPSQIKRGRGKFCSRGCYYGVKIKRICWQCGAEFAVTSSRIKEGKGKFCSQKCSKESQRRKITRICLICGNEFEIKASYFKRGKGIFCSTQCYGKWQSGENNSQWKGGKSFEPYCTKFNNEFKEYIREKFNRICFLCQKPEEENGQRLSVHHVNYDKSCMCNDNLTCQFVPLCKSCNNKVNKDREMWESKIKNIMQNKLNGWFI